MEAVRRWAAVCGRGDPVRRVRRRVRGRRLAEGGVREGTSGQGNPGCGRRTEGGADGRVREADPPGG